MSMADEIAKLYELQQRGAMSEQEYLKAKESLLAGNPPAGQKFQQAWDGLRTNDNMWGMFIHLSQFCGYLVPLAGLILPIVLWQIRKNESPVIDQHGRIVVNWIITKLILGVVFGILCFFLVGIPLLILLALVGLIFPIVGAIKANDGKTWSYPCAIRFFR